MSGEAALQAVATLVAIGCFYAFFYTHVVSRWGPLVQPLVRLLRRDGSHSARDIAALGRLGAAAVAQGAFATAMIIILGVNPREVANIPGPMQIALGVGLGIAELGFSTFVCTLAMQILLAAAGGRRDDWLGPGRAGWMGQFLAAGRVAPWWLFALCVLIYVAGEEIIFRAVLIETLRPAGAMIAVGVSIVCFVGVQALHMPSARSALFPLIGGLVVGCVHSTLYWQAPDVVPLVFAHATFFAGALLGLGGAAKVARTQ